MYKLNSKGNMIVADKIMNINRLPEIKAFLESEPPDVVISGGKEKRYQCRLSLSHVEDVRIVNMTLLDVACFFGKLNHITALGYTRNEMRAAIKAQGCLDFIYAVLSGNMPTLQHLETYLTPDETKAAVQANNYEAIRFAVIDGHTATLQHLETHLTPDEKKAAVKERSYGAIRIAARGGHTVTLQHLETHLTSDEKKAAVQA
jgi:hypothetical protein